MLPKELPPRDQTVPNGRLRPHGWRAVHIFQLVTVDIGRSWGNSQNATRNSPPPPLHPLPNGRVLPATEVNPEWLPTSSRPPPTKTQILGCKGNWQAPEPGQQTGGISGEKRHSHCPAARRIKKRQDNCGLWPNARANPTRTTERSMRQPQGPSRMWQCLAIVQTVSAAMVKDTRRVFHWFASLGRQLSKGNPVQSSVCPAGQSRTRKRSGGKNGAGMKHVCPI